MSCDSRYEKKKRVASTAFVCCDSHRKNKSTHGFYVMRLMRSLEDHVRAL